MKKTVRAHTDKLVALTFDDGPSIWTSDLLDLLAKHDAHATFFVLGSHIAENEHLVRTQIMEGHELGVHGWDHTPVETLGYHEIVKQLADTCEQISKNGDTVLRWWRPPWHRLTNQAVAAAETLGLSYCGVTLDTYDVNRSEERIAKAVYDDVKSRTIVGMHDGIASNGNHETPHRENTVGAVDRILRTLTPQYRFVTVSELLK